MSSLASSASPLALATALPAAQAVGKLLYGIEEVGTATGLGRNTIYKEIAARRLQIVKVGRRTLIRVEDLRAFVDSLGAEA